MSSLVEEAGLPLARLVVGWTTGADRVGPVANCRLQSEVRLPQGIDLVTRFHVDL